MLKINSRIFYFIKNIPSDHEKRKTAVLHCLYIGSLILVEVAD